MTDRNVRSAAIADARALLDTMRTSAWEEVHIADATTEIFIARERGRPNPMRVAQVAEIPARGEEAPVISVVAPHVATLVHVEALGTRMAAGQIVATIEVLGIEERIEAPLSGKIVETFGAAGDLLEYGMPICMMSDAD